MLINKNKSCSLQRYFNALNTFEFPLLTQLFIFQRHLLNRARWNYKVLADGGEVMLEVLNQELFPRDEHSPSSGIHV